MYRQLERACFPNQSSGDGAWLGTPGKADREDWRHCTLRRLASRLEQVQKLWFNVQCVLETVLEVRHGISGSQLPAETIFRWTREIVSRLSPLDRERFLLEYQRADYYDLLHACRRLLCQQELIDDRATIP